MLLCVFYLLRIIKITIYTRVVSIVLQSIALLIAKFQSIANSIPKSIVIFGEADFF